MSEADAGVSGTGFDDAVNALVKEAVWAFLATAGGTQPHVRVIHPIWEGTTVWMVSRRHSPKARQLERNPRAELFYWTKAGLHLTVTGRAAFVEDAAEKARLWALFKAHPVGYDPGAIWKSADDPEFGLLRLDPVRIEYFDVTQVGRGGQKHVWRPGQ